MPELVGLKEKWKNELNDPKTYISNKRNNIIAVLQLSELLVDKHIKKRNHKYDKMKAISLYFYTHANELTSGVYFSSKHGFGSASLILCRSLLESLIDFSYLFLCKRINGTDKERTGWLDYRSHTKYSIHKRWSEFKINNPHLGFYRNDESVKEEAVSHMKQQSDDFKRDYFKHGNIYSWAINPTLEKRARAVDGTGYFIQDFSSNVSLEEDYVLIYKHTSEIAHAQSGSTSSYINQEEKPHFHFGPSNKNIEMATAAACNYMLTHLYLFNKIHHLDIDIIAQLNNFGFQVSASSPE